MQTKSISKNLPVRLALTLLLSGMVASATPTTVTFDFVLSGGTGSTTAFGNTRTYFNATTGLTMVASAWSNTGTSGVMQTAHLLNFASAGYGSGVCNREEVASAGDCTFANHQVDNFENNVSGSTGTANTLNEVDFILLQFDHEVTLSSLDINPYCPTCTPAGYDRDVTYFYGNTTYGSTSFISGRTVSYLTATAGLTRVDDDSTVSEDMRRVTLSPVKVNTLLIAARISGSGADTISDRWKTDAVAVTVTPEPGTFAMVGIALIALGLVRRKAQAARS